LFGGEVAATTGSETAGTVAGATYDLILPPEIVMGAPYLILTSIQDVQAVADFVASLLNGSSEGPAEEEEELDLDAHGSVFGERVRCERSGTGDNFCS
jgi:hypothetical protein